jgi:peptidoglycan/xylan/chitin deacetylase (PgdA/CDA1 family)
VNSLKRFLLLFAVAVLTAVTVLPAIEAQAAATNLIANPSVETASSANANLPQNWEEGSWGTNTTAFSYPTTGHTGSRSVEVQMTSYTSGDAKWYFNPVAVTAGSSYIYSDYYQSSVPTEVVAQYQTSGGTLSYQTLGSAPASTAWSQYAFNLTVPSGITEMTVFHLIQSVGTLQTDDFSLTSAPAVTVPTVSITAPSANATVSGTVNVTANASDASGIKSVQFELDGQTLGNAVTATPYQTSWNTTTTANGTHSLTAIATNTSGKTTTSTAISVDVDNTSGNLIPNPLAQIVNPTNSELPENWSTAGWGANTTTFTYGGTGYGGSKSLNIKMSQYTDGDAKWVFDAIPVTQDQMYKFSEYYESNVQTEVDAVFNMSDGTTVYQIISLPAAATTWTNLTTEFAVPIGAQSMTIYHLLDSIGPNNTASTLTTSDFSLTDYVPVGFKAPLVSLTFDDGYASTYTNTVPILKQYGLTGTQFIITDLLNQPGYLTSAQVKSIYDGGNEEIASHTVTHDDLTQETATQLQTEMSQSQATLKSITGVSPTDLAYPYGLYNTAVVSAAKQYYTAARGVEEGFNSKDNFNPYDLKVQNIYDTTTTAQVADWVAQAKATDTWLILVYHSVDNDPNPLTDAGIYNITTTQFSDQLAAIKAAGVTVGTTIQQALQQLTPQL